MYESYLDRVGHWIQEAPSKDWTKDYAKETTYERTYMYVRPLLPLLS